MPCLREHRVSRMPSLASVVRALNDCHKQSDESKLQKHGGSGGDMFVTRNIGDDRTKFIINPGGDLKRTEKKFRDTFERFSSECGVNWGGTYGVPPDPQEYYEKTLPECEMIIFCGHGSSEAFF